MALLWRKVTTLRKDYRVVVMAVLNPTIQIALMSVAIGLNPKFLPFGDVNQDQGSARTTEDSHLITHTQHNNNNNNIF